MSSIGKINDLNYLPEERIQAIFKSLNDTSEEAIDELIYCLFHDPSPIVRHEAAYIMGEKNNQKGSNALIDAIKSDKNHFVVHEAALAIANMGDKESKSSLQDLLKSEDPNLVDTAEIALQRLDMRLNYIYFEDLGKEPKELIMDLNALKEHRIQASFELMKEGSEDSIDVLLEALNQETSPIVKHEIIFSLGETASSRVVPSLIKVLNNDFNDFVQHEACLALATIGNMDAFEILQEKTTSPIKEVAETATIALTRLNSN